MRFPFVVKHNGVLYEPGKEVPIGKEPKKEIEVEDKTASELSKELKDKYGIDMAPQKGKAKLQEVLEEAEKKAKEEEEVKDIDEDEEFKINDNDNEESFLDKIINE